MLSKIFLLILILISFNSFSNEITFYNYKKIVENQENGIFLNPFNKESNIFILQNLNKEIPFLNMLSDNAKEVIRISEDYSNQKDFRKRQAVIFLSPIFKLSDDSNTYFLSFLKNSFEYNELSNQWRKREVHKYIDEFIFLHELFHTENYKVTGTSYDHRTREGLSDISAIIVLIKSYNLNKKDSLKLARSVYHLRERAAENFGNYSHFAKEELINFINFLNKNHPFNIEEDFLSVHHLATEIIGI